MATKATPAHLTKKARKWNRATLGAILDDVLAGKQIRGWPKGLALEYAILRMFELELESADVIWPFEVKLEGLTVEQIDGVVHAGHLSCLIETKCWNEPAYMEPIAKLRTQLARRPPGTFGVIFSAKGFTKEAKTLLRYLAPTQILTWEGRELRASFARTGMVDGLIKKHRHAVEHGLPDSSLMGERS